MNYDVMKSAVADIAGQLKALADAYGPAVADTAITMAKIEIAGILIRSSFFVIMCIVGIALVLRLRRKCTAMVEFRGEDGQAMSWFIASFPLMLATAGIIDRAMALLNVWLWVGLYRPELYIAAKALKLT